MLFNSLDFAIFLPIVFLLYWFVANKNLKQQNTLIVAASYLFYSWWDWRFLSLIIFSTVVDYTIGRKLKNEENITKRKAFLWTSVIVNLGFLGYFKYYNFFLDNFITAFSFFGTPINAQGLNIILPVGISFYTFQTLSYTIDVYKRKLEPTKDFIAFSAFVSFFPQLVAGPIERATNLLPQITRKRTFDYVKAVDGMRQILWGLFKKVVIADNSAQMVNEIFNNSGEYSGSTLAVGTVFFAIQVYGDFSGYSDIAIGTSRLFGFNLKQNFAFPYFSRDIAEFWRRWHISLSTWFRDYLYIPLGGSRGGTYTKIRNTVIIFVVSGFWHGANWTCVVWGALHAVFTVPLILSNNNRNHLDVVAQGKLFPTLKEFFQIITTFSLHVFALTIFRANNIEHAYQYLVGMFSKSLLTIPHFPQQREAFYTMILTVLFTIVEWLGRHEQYAIQNTREVKNKYLRYGFYFLIVFLIINMGNFSENQFIYFQF